MSKRRTGKAGGEMDYELRIKELEAELAVLRRELKEARTCPVCNKVESDLLEACSECYNKQIALQGKSQKIKLFGDKISKMSFWDLKQLSEILNCRYVYETYGETAKRLCEQGFAYEADFYDAMAFRYREIVEGGKDTQ